MSDEKRCRESEHSIEASDPDCDRHAAASRLFRDVKKQLNTLLTKIDQADLLADSLSFDIAALEKFFETGRMPPVSPQATPGRRQERTQADEHLRQLAATGAHSLETKLRADGDFEVRIDGGKRFTLPPLLADVLRILAIDNGPSNDELVGWKTLDEVAILLGKETGRPVKKHAVTQNVYRLRKAMFAQGGANPYLIQTSRQRGVRFAQRRRAVAAITCDPS